MTGLKELLARLTKDTFPHATIFQKLCCPSYMQNAIWKKKFAAFNIFNQVDRLVFLA